jgi:hypothetical protein
VAYHSNQQIYVAGGSTIYALDSRKEGILLSEISCRSEKHSDDVNHLAFSRDFNMLAACDDEGDCCIYNQNLERTHLLDQ